MRKNGFTLIELLVVIVIIGILAGIGISQYNTYMAKARNAVRVADMQTIYKALMLYHTEKGYLPTTSRYGEENAGTWDYSSQGNFLTFLKDEGYLNTVPVDPINNTPGDNNAGTYAYRYFCYTKSNRNNNNGLWLGYKEELTDNMIRFDVTGESGGARVAADWGTDKWTNSAFNCKN